MTKEKIKQYQKEYQLKNAEKIKKQRKQKRLDNSELVKKLDKQKYLNNREKILERDKQHYLKNREKILEKAKQRYLKNAEKNKEIRTNKIIALNFVLDEIQKKIETCDSFECIEKLEYLEIRKKVIISKIKNYCNNKELQNV